MGLFSLAGEALTSERVPAHVAQFVPAGAASARPATQDVAPVVAAHLAAQLPQGAQVGKRTQGYGKPVGSGLCS